jgi:hypothetical protein
VSAPPPGALAALARKYRALEALREAHARGEPGPGRAALAALAAEFPGALRELDQRTLASIRGCAAALEAAAAGGAVAPWMARVDALHRLTRAALFVRAHARRGAGDPELEGVARAASTDAGAPVDLAFARAVLAPPGGRFVAVVRARVAAAYGEGDPLAEP